MKKTLSIFKIILGLFAATLLFGCASDSQEEKKDSPESNEDLLTGQWFFNYGDDQDEFVNELLTCNADRTVKLLRDVPNHPDYYEYYEGTYEIIDDETFGPTFKLNMLIGWHPEKHEIVECGISNFYDLQSLTADNLLMDRYKRIYPNGEVETFDPAVKNHYLKVKNGTAASLKGNWKVNQLATPDCTWDESWTYNADGTMTDYYEEGDYKGWSKGTYEVTVQDGKSILHQVLTHESADNVTFTESTSPSEYWYEFKTYGENLLYLNCTKTKMNGEVHEHNPAIENYYYRVK